MTMFFTYVIWMESCSQSIDWCHTLNNNTRWMNALTYPILKRRQELLPTWKAREQKRLSWFTLFLVFGSLKSNRKRCALEASQYIGHRREAWSISPQCNSAFSLMPMRWYMLWLLHRYFGNFTEMSQRGEKSNVLDTGLLCFPGVLTGTGEIPS